MSERAVLQPLLRPTQTQLAWQRLEIGMFFHFGVNTFHGKEWSDGTLPAASFDPDELDAGAWIETAVDAGARYVVLTAKHHDGFCLWPTETTGYSVRSSPWRGGNGDVVAEVARACAQAGIGLGLYLSPWDRNAPQYADPQQYTAMYTSQLRELCTRYGPLVELWFDGAGSEGYHYDWPAIMAVVREHQPQAAVFNMGEPTIRWVGNEDGLAQDPVRYVVDHTLMSTYTVVTSQFEQALYLPPECDVSLRRGWFWQPEEEPKTLEHLLAIYYRSVGMGANLLLNVPPDRRGLIDPQDATRVRELGAELRRRFGRPVDAELSTPRAGTWRARLPESMHIDHLRLREDLTDGQRVARHRVFDGDRLLAQGQTIGAGRLHLVPAGPVRELRIEVDGDEARLSSVEVFCTGDTHLPQVPVGYVAPTDYPDS